MMDHLNDAVEYIEKAKKQTGAEASLSVIAAVHELTEALKSLHGSGNIGNKPA